MAKGFEDSRARVPALELIHIHLLANNILHRFPQRSNLAAKSGSPCDNAISTNQAGCTPLFACCGTLRKREKESQSERARYRGSMSVDDNVRGIRKTENMLLHLQPKKSCPLSAEGSLARVSPVAISHR